MTEPIDPVALSRALIRCPSVTPEDAGALDLLVQALEPMGFRCRRLTFSADGTAEVDNLYARFGTGHPNFCFAGHTDVVPVGERSAWSRDPFAAELEDGVLFGRGAVDMKSAVAAFVAAADRFLVRRGRALEGSISLLVTGDEEGPAVNGTAKVLDWMGENGERIDACLVGEPTNPEALGEMIKVGRRGSLSGRITVHGVQGHAAYPEFADNPIPRLLRILLAITDTPLDSGTDHFQPSTVSITTVDVGNPAANVTPARAEARFNIRFNDLHTGESVLGWLRERCRSVDGDCDLEVHVSGEPFLSPPGPLSALVSAAVEEALGRRPELGTTGGTSDARFIKDHCPVAEFGLVGKTMHQVDERVDVADISRLADIYEAVLERFFASGG